MTYLNEIVRFDLSRCNTPIQKIDAIAFNLKKYLTKNKFLPSFFLCEEQREYLVGQKNHKFNLEKVGICGVSFMSFGKECGKEYCEGLEGEHLHIFSTENLPLGENEATSKLWYLDFISARWEMSPALKYDIKNGVCRTILDINELVNIARYQNRK